MKEQELQETENLPKPQGLLYHYTDQKGLLGILDNKSIWATHIRYLNDASEYIHGITIAKKLIKELNIDAGPVLKAIDSDEASMQMKESIGVAISDVLNRIDEVSVFVASFFDSEKERSPEETQDAGDNLGQWRAYSRGSAGFSIGFDKALLSDYIQELGDEYECPITSASCVYDVQVQQDYLNSVVGEIGPIVLQHLQSSMDNFMANGFPTLMEMAKKNINNMPPDEIMQRVIAGAASKFSEIYQQGAEAFSASMIPILTKIVIPPIFMKKPAFRDEHEWRIAKLYSGSSSDFLFRPGKSSLVPYISVPLPLLREDGSSLIRRIVVGPSPVIKDAVTAVKMLVEKKGYMVAGPGKIYGIEIIPSKIPYRDW